PVGFVDQLNHYQEGDGPSYCYAILILEFTPSYRTLLSLNSCRTTSMLVLFCTHSLRIWLAKPDKVIHVTPIKWTSLTATAHSDDWVHVSSGKKREVVVERPDPAAPGVLDNRKNGDWLRNRTAQPIVQDRPDGFEARGQHQLAQPASKRNVDHMWRA